MSNEQLALFLQIIISQLNKGIDNVEKELENTRFRIETGGTNVFFDPKTIDYPILSDIYQLRYDLAMGIEQLKKKEKTNEQL